MVACGLKSSGTGCVHCLAMRAALVPKTCTCRRLTSSFWCTAPCSARARRCRAAAAAQPSCSLPKELAWSTAGGDSSQPASPLLPLLGVAGAVSGAAKGLPGVRAAAASNGPPAMSGSQSGAAWAHTLPPTAKGEAGRGPGLGGAVALPALACAWPGRGHCCCVGGCWKMASVSPGSDTTGRARAASHAAPADAVSSTSSWLGSAMLIRPPPLIRLSSNSSSAHIGGCARGARAGGSAAWERVGEGDKEGCPEARKVSCGSSYAVAEDAVDRHGKS